MKVGPDLEQVKIIERAIEEFFRVGDNAFKQNLVVNIIGGIAGNFLNLFFCQWVASFISLSQPMTMVIPTSIAALPKDILEQHILRVLPSYTLAVCCWVDQRWRKCCSRLLKKSPQQEAILLSLFEEGPPIKLLDLFQQQLCYPVVPPKFPYLFFLAARGTSVFSFIFSFIIISIIFFKHTTHHASSHRWSFTHFAIHTAEYCISFHSRSVQDFLCC